MKKIAKIAATGLLVLSLTAVTSAPATYAASACVSKAEFKKLKNGMTKAKVKSITGTGGTLVSAAGTGSFRIEIRSYKACTQFGAVSIGYMGGKLNSKTGIF